MCRSGKFHESEILDRIALRYEKHGYSVNRDVPLEGSSMRADLVARRGDETVLVEVKAPFYEPDSPQLGELAAYAEQHGWRFSIAIAREDGAVEEVDVPTREQVLRWIADARTIAPASWMASLAATAAFEAAARHALARTERRTLPRASPSAHLQALASRGLVTPDEERVLRTLIDARNAAAHGIKMPSLAVDTVPKTLQIATALVEGESLAG